MGKQWLGGRKLPIVEADEEFLMAFEDEDTSEYIESDIDAVLERWLNGEEVDDLEVWDAWDEKYENEEDTGAGLV